MKIIAISDLHGKLPDKIYEGDLLLIAGDICPNYDQENWLKYKFIPWCEKQDVPKIIIIAGNHDFYFEQYGKNHETMSNLFWNTNIIYLENTLYEFEGIRIFGTPYCKQFGNWAFNKTPDELTELFSEIPDKIDILLTHDAPYGTSDVCDQVWCSYGHIGNLQLRDAILDKSPKYNIHGHLHTSNHEFEVLGDTKVINVSLLDEQYSLFFNETILFI